MQALKKNRNLFTICPQPAFVGSCFFAPVCFRVRQIRFLLVVFSLVFAQLLLGAHALEHAWGKADQDGGPGSPACELCLAAHDLGAALPGSALSLPVCPPDLPQVHEAMAGRVALPAPLARQRAPPQA